VLANGLRTTHGGPECEKACLSEENLICSAAMKPHRATTVLLLGILSLVVCAPLGFAAWVMGNNDLREMDNGLMDPSGRDSTSAGRICGIIGSVLCILAVIAAIVMFVFVGVAGFVAVQSEQNRIEMTPEPTR
jgi:hypothetical protein